MNKLFLALCLSAISFTAISFTAIATEVHTSMQVSLTITTPPVDTSHIQVNCTTDRCTAVDPSNPHPIDYLLKTRQACDPAHATCDPQATVYF